MITPSMVVRHATYILRQMGVDKCEFAGDAAGSEPLARMAVPFSIEDRRSSIDDFGENYLMPTCACLSGTLLAAHATFNLPLEKGKNGARHLVDGLSMRGTVEGDKLILDVAWR